MKLAHFNWVEIVLESKLPPNAKYLALYLSTFMNGKNQVAWPSLARISHETGLTRPTIIKWLDCMNSEGWLIKTKSVRSTNGGNQANNEYAINLPKSVEEGGKTNLPPTQKGGKAIFKRGLNDFQKGVKPFYPNNNTINNLNNNVGEKPSDENSAKMRWTTEDNNLAEYMIEKIQDIAPSAKKGVKWPDHIRLMRERDDRSHEEIKDMFDWANNHHFWKTNILSPATLRSQWVKLEAQKGVDQSSASQQDESAMTETELYNKYRPIGLEMGIHPGGSEQHRDYVARVKDAMNEKL